MRLIEADALREVMYHEAFEKDSDMQKWDGGCWIRYKLFENAIENAPTIEERKTGWWMEFDIPWYQCSECGAVRKNQSFMENYCPNCGAKMDEGMTVRA